MSEEEIMDTINKLFTIEEVLIQDDIEGHSSAYEMQFEDFVAIHGLLDIIKKQQKEIQDLKNDHINFWINTKEVEDMVRGKFINKDKIKEKIEKLENYNFKGNFDDINFIQNIIQQFKELLGD